MSSQCRYPGNVVDELIAAAESGHLWGPDMCGERRTVWDDVCTSFRVGGSAQLVAMIAADVLPRGAMYELHDAQYNPVTNKTTAWFTPKVNPLQNVRYHGGAEDPDRAPILPGRGGLARRDNIKAR